MAKFTFARALRGFSDSRDKALDQLRSLEDRRWWAASARDWVKAIRWWAHQEHREHWNKAIKKAEASQAQLGEV